MQRTQAASHSGRLEPWTGGCSPQRTGRLKAPRCPVHCFRPDENFNDLR